MHACICVCVCVSMHTVCVYIYMCANWCVCAHVNACMHACLLVKVYNTSMSTGILYTTFSIFSVKDSPPSILQLPLIIVIHLDPPPPIPLPFPPPPKQRKGSKSTKLISDLLDVGEVNGRDVRNWHDDWQPTAAHLGHGNRAVQLERGGADRRGGIAWQPRL